MVGLVGAGLEVVDDMHTKQNQVGRSHVGRCRSTYRVRGDTLMSPDHTAVQLRGSGLDQAEIGRSFLKGRSTGRHEKATNRRSTALHDAPRTCEFSLLARRVTSLMNKHI